MVLIPSYNPGGKVFETVRAAREQWEPVWVVVDGSTDGTGGSSSRDGRARPGIAGARPREEWGQGRRGP